MVYACALRLYMLRYVPKAKGDLLLHCMDRISVYFIQFLSMDPLRALDGFFLDRLSITAILECV